jgi:sulfatase maturation enzyme AslB (radical SAM superfamily)
MENKKQTAIEFLGHELNVKLFYNITPELWEQVNEIFKQAKEMENREIRFDIEEKWKQFRSITNNEDAWLFKEWLIEQTYGGNK